MIYGGKLISKVHMPLEFYTLGVILPVPTALGSCILTHESSILCFWRKLTLFLYSLHRRNNMERILFAVPLDKVPYIKNWGLCISYYCYVYTGSEVSNPYHFVDALHPAHVAHVLL